MLNKRSQELVALRRRTTQTQPDLMYEEKSRVIDGSEAQAPSKAGKMHPPQTHPLPLTQVHVSRFFVLNLYH